MSVLYEALPALLYEKTSVRLFEHFGYKKKKKKREKGIIFS